MSYNQVPPPSQTLRRLNTPQNRQNPRLPNGVISKGIGQGSMGQLQYQSQNNLSNYNNFIPFNQPYQSSMIPPQMNQGSQSYQGNIVPHPVNHHQPIQPPPPPPGVYELPIPPTKSIHFQQFQAPLPPPSPPPGLESHYSSSKNANLRNPPLPPPSASPATKQYPQPQRFLHQLPPCSQPQFGLPLHPLTSTATTNHVSTPVPTSLCNQSQPERPPELSWSDPGQMNLRKYEEKVVSDLPFVPVTMNPQELEVMSQAIQQQAEEGSSYTVKYLQSKGLIDPLLPQQLKEMFGALYCKLCTLTLSSPVVAQAHYVGKKHKKKIDQWLNEHRLETLQSSFVRSGSGIPGTVKPVKSGATTNNNIHSQPSSMQSAVKQRPKHLKRSGLGNSGVPNKKIRKAGEAGPNFDFCAICQIELTSAAHANQHYNGQKHTAKMLKHTRNFGACNLEDRTFGIGKVFHKQN